jgi:ketosteroid isomerase-like protein
MPPTNEELAQLTYDRLRADDVEGFLEYVDPDAEWHSLFLEIEGVFRGHDGVREWWRALHTIFPDWDPSLVEIRDFGDVVVTQAAATGSGAASGVGLDNHFWQVVKLRDGKIVRYRAARTEAEAIEIAEDWRELAT